MHHGLVSDNHDYRLNAPREDISYPDTHHNPTYSPARMAHHGNASHYGSNQNYYGSQQQSYKQEHPSYSGYPSQNYYYPTHYDSHAAQPTYDSTIDYYHHPQDLVDTHGDDPLSLMWSNETSKAHKYKNTPANDPYTHHQVAKPKHNPMYDRHYEQSAEDMYVGNYNHDPRRDQMMMKPQQERTGYPVKRSMEPHHTGLNPHGMSQNVAMKTVGGPMRYNPEPVPQRKPSGNLRLWFFF